MIADQVDMVHLLARVNDLEARVAHLEAALKANGCGGFVDGYGDQRDQAVLACPLPGQQVSAKALRSIYRKETDIFNTSTLKRRVKDLTRCGQFEPVRMGVWEFTGGEKDE